MNKQILFFPEKQNSQNKPVLRYFLHDVELEYVHIQQHLQQYQVNL